MDREKQLYSYCVWHVCPKQYLSTCSFAWSQPQLAQWPIFSLPQLWALNLFAENEPKSVYSFVSIHAVPIIEVFEKKKGIGNMLLALNLL